MVAGQLMKRQRKLTDETSEASTIGSRQTTEGGGPESPLTLAYTALSEETVFDGKKD